MTNELTKNLYCISLRNGVELWIEEDRIENFKKVLETKRFIEIDNRVINSVDVVGIFLAKDMEDITRKKQGQWKDKKGVWRDKNERICPRCSTVLPWGTNCGNCS